LVFIVDLLQVTLARCVVFTGDTTGPGGFFPVGGKNVQVHLNDAQSKA
jgi:hypothetical protein